MMIITPICMLFSTSSRTIANARSLTIATSLANGYLSAVKKVPVTGEFGAVKDTDAPSPFTPEELGVPESPEGFTRTVRLLKLADPGSGKDYYRACIMVEWEGTGKQKIRKYSLDTIVTGGSGS
ncbi:MAG: hypothetical protein H8E17_02990 [Deltaproteobacteria bacterium]|nr:hypothetical protein [Deltaproteobacteria bacterium]